MLHQALLICGDKVEKKNKHNQQNVKKLTKKMKK